MGNCVTCWKKSLRKLLTIARDEPERFEFCREMEREYKHTGAGDEPNGRVFFREGRSANDILALAEIGAFKPFIEQQEWQAGLDLDSNSGCSESCEPY